MEFCQVCHRYMDRVAESNARVVFECRSCAQKKNGTAEQSLWRESRSVGVNDRTTSFLERAPYDLAAKCVPHDCGKCHRRFVILTRVEGVTAYRCECGNVIDPREIDV